jgi:hypothetical protein
MQVSRDLLDRSRAVNLPRLKSLVPEGCRGKATRCPYSACWTVLCELLCFGKDATTSRVSDHLGSGRALVPVCALQLVRLARRERRLKRVAGQ